MVTDDEVALIDRGLAISRPQHGSATDAAAVDGHGNLVAILVPHDADHLRPKSPERRPTSPRSRHAPT